jgi:hypothetical protein
MFASKAVAYPSEAPFKWGQTALSTQNVTTFLSLPDLERQKKKVQSEEREKYCHQLI